MMVSQARYPLRGVVAVPGDKSVSHRSLILAGLAEGESWLSGVADGEDVGRTAAALRAFGVEVENVAGSAWRVVGGAWSAPVGAIDCGNSGTSARLLIGAAAGRGVAATFTGDASLRRRPMTRVTEPLALMGARFEGGERLPLTLLAGAPGPIRHVNRPASAQVKSAVLLAGLGGNAEVVVVEPVPSRDHLERLLPTFGGEVVVDGDTLRLGATRRLRGAQVAVAGDPSSAAFPLVSALLVPGSEVTVTGVMVNPLRMGLFEALAQMGADLRFENRRLVGGEPVADVSMRASRLRGATVAAARIPAMVDEVPVLAVAAAFADGATRIDGLAELRHKESDRLAAIVDGLQACGVEARTDGDSLIVQGGRVRGGARVDSRGDHRIAMAFAVLGLAAEEPVTVSDAEMIATSWPGFADAMRSIGARIAA